MKNQNICWCGNEQLLPFSEEYLRCPVCETLVYRYAVDEDFVDVQEDEEDFYGKNYWFEHQEADLGQDNIVKRAQTDLTERDLYWLRTLLKYKKPSGKALELGCAHGGFVKLLKWVGFDAAGLELSPWIVDFARKTFDIPVLLGPVEEQDLEPGSFDVIVLMDVLEHLPDPLATISHCVSLLKPDGILYLQTPNYPAGASHESLLQENHPFLRLLIPREHIYLFSQKSIAAFFERIGLPHYSFEPAIFGHYDMSVVASKSPLQTFTQTEIDEGLLAHPNSRLVLALLDLYTSQEALLEQYLVADKDRTARLESINELEALLKESEADRAARLKSMQTLEALLKESEADRAARLGVIHNLENERNVLNERTNALIERTKQLEEELDKSIFWHISRKVKHQIRKLRKGDGQR